ncbi:DUF1294 domain-containing protein [Patescibacteria group bacterium]|nr:DUF1294 domain-containing protein [Patescibacteria group bacterium]MBU1895548.1 DUF1294 domain-containing protein [Patescibacteria group bacterium]
MANWFFEISLSSQILLVYFVAINIVTFFYFGLDKRKARFGNRRIREKTLWILSLLGGSIGALAGMKFFRHKTKKTSFQAVFLLIFLLQLAIVFLLIK